MSPNSSRHLKDQASRALNSASLSESPCDSSRIQANSRVMDNCMLAVYKGCKLSSPAFCRIISLLEK